jgi:tRNA (guanine37-N1)-methyltransferase
LVIIDAIVRLLPGAVGDERSLDEESFSWGILDYPHYTRPPQWQGLSVPEVLLSGNHRQIQLWRRKEALKGTLKRRPDLLEKAHLSEEDLKLLESIKEEEY